MAKTMSASTITNGQIENILDKLRAALRKKKSTLNREHIQYVCGLDNLGMAMFEVIEGRVQLISEMVIHEVKKIDRTRTPQEALDATRLRQDLDMRVVAGMPRGKNDSAKIYFFEEERFNNDQLPAEYAKRGLIPVDPYTLCALNERDTKLATCFSNATFWENKDGRKCCACFENGSVTVSARLPDFVVWWAGLRK